jgi:hypothetical protein
MKINIKLLTRTLLILVCFFSVHTVAAKDNPPETSHDGLVLIKDSKVDIAYALPGADLSGYDKVMILEALIAFKKNWQRDYNRSSTLGGRISDKDMERAISRGKDLFHHAFVDVLEERGFPVVNEAGADVLLVRPAIINLDVVAPDKQTAGRSRSYSASAGEATLYVELYDSVTSQILARASDRKSNRNSVNWAMSRTSVSNTADFTRGLKYWAELLVDAMNNAKKNAID